MAGRDRRPSKDQLIKEVYLLSAKSPGHVHEACGVLEQACEVSQEVMLDGVYGLPQEARRCRVTNSASLISSCLTSANSNVRDTYSYMRS